MDRQTLRDWVHRYKELGVAGLFDHPRSNGPRARLLPEQQTKVAAWVEQGPDLERDGIVRWRCVHLQQRIAQEFAISLHERTVGKLLRKLSSGGCRCVRSTRGTSLRHKRFSKWVC